MSYVVIFISFIFLSLFLFFKCGAWFAGNFINCRGCTFCPFSHPDPRVNPYSYRDRGSSYFALSGLVLFPVVLYFSFLIRYFLFCYFLSLFLFPICGAWFANDLFNCRRCTFFPFSLFFPRVNPDSYRDRGYSRLTLSVSFFFLSSPFRGFFLSFPLGGNKKGAYPSPLGGIEGGFLSEIFRPHIASPKKVHIPSECKFVSSTLVGEYIGIGNVHCKTYA